MTGKALCESESILTANSMWQTLSYMLQLHHMWKLVLCDSDSSMWQWQLYVKVSSFWQQTLSDRHQATCCNYPCDSELFMTVTALCESEFILTANSMWQTSSSMLCYIANNSDLCVTLSSVWQWQLYVKVGTFWQQTICDRHQVPCYATSHVTVSEFYVTSKLHVAVISFMTVTACSESILTALCDTELSVTVTSAWFPRKCRHHWQTGMTHWRCTHIHQALLSTTLNVSDCDKSFIARKFLHCYSCLQDVYSCSIRRWVKRVN